LAYPYSNQDHKCETQKQVSLSLEMRAGPLLPSKAESPHHAATDALVRVDPAQGKESPLKANFGVSRD
jgi:hypothetical protein